MFFITVYDLFRVNKKIHHTRQHMTSQSKKLMATPGIVQLLSATLFPMENRDPPLKKTVNVLLSMASTSLKTGTPTDESLGNCWISFVQSATKKGHENLYKQPISLLKSGSCISFILYCVFLGCMLSFLKTLLNDFAHIPWEDTPDFPKPQTSWNLGSFWCPSSRWPCG